MIFGYQKVIYCRITSVTKSFLEDIIIKNLPKNIRITKIYQKITQGQVVKMCISLFANI